MPRGKSKHPGLSSACQPSERMIVPFTAIVADRGICGSAEFFDHTGCVACHRNSLTVIPKKRSPPRRRAPRRRAHRGFLSASFRRPLYLAGAKFLSSRQRIWTVVAGIMPLAPSYRLPADGAMVLRLELTGSPFGFPESPLWALIRSKANLLPSARLS
jgi:hypothetical protein